MPHKHAIILLIAIVIGVIAGVASGWIWGETMTSIKWMGDLFLHALKTGDPAFDRSGCDQWRLFTW